MSLYVPPFRVPLDEWCGWTGNNWDKVKAVVGHSFRVVFVTAAIMMGLV